MAKTSLERGKKWREKNKEKLAEYQRVWRIKNKIKKDAHIAVKKAIERKELVRPTKCDVCGAGGLIDAHHHDYDKPLDVNWLCRKCHSKEHFRLNSVPKNYMKGATHIYAKLNEQKVKEIWKLIKAGISDPNIAHKYKVKAVAIRDIRRGKNWKHVIVSD